MPIESSAQISASTLVKKNRTYRAFAMQRAAVIRTWLIYILIMLWVGRKAIFIRPRDNYAAIDLLAMIQISIVMLICVLFFLSPMINFWRQIRKSSLKFYFIYLALGAGSAFWSINPEYSLYRAIEAAAMSAAVLYFCTSAESLEESIRRVKLIMWPTIMANWTGLILLIGFSLKLRLNGFGATAALIACFFASLILVQRQTVNKKFLLQLGLAFFLLVISWSLASWWSFWFGVCYCLVFTRRKGLVMVFVLIGITLFLSLDHQTRTSLILRDKQVEDLSSMTGRRGLWTEYLEASCKRPLLGFGFAIGAREVGHIYTTNAHNVFFGTLLGVGWIGVGILGLFFISLARELLRYKHFKHPPWLACASALAAGCLNTMSVSILGEQFTLPATVFVALLGFHMVCLRESKNGTLSFKPAAKSPRPSIKIRW